MDYERARDISLIPKVIAIDYTLNSKIEIKYN